MDKTLLTNFLARYGYFEKLETAEDFVEQTPVSAFELAKRIASGSGEEAVKELEKITS